MPDRFSDDLAFNLDSFLDVVDVKRLNRHLRFMMLCHLQAGTVNYQNEILQDVEFLFIFLDAAEDEQPVRLQKFHPELVKAAGQ